MCVDLCIHDEDRGEINRQAEISNNQMKQLKARSLLRQAQRGNRSVQGREGLLGRRYERQNRPAAHQGLESGTEEADSRKIRRL